jgi:hypothetical protein
LDKTAQCGISWFLLLVKCYSDDQITKNEVRNVTGRREMHPVWWGNMTEGDHLEDIRVDGKIILKCIFREWCENVWTALLWSSKGQVEGNCEHGNEFLVP